jgi:hypothetical protein
MWLTGVSNPRKSGMSVFHGPRKCGGVVFSFTHVWCSQVARKSGNAVGPENNVDVWFYHVPIPRNLGVLCFNVQKMWGVCSFDVPHER